MIRIVKRYTRVFRNIRLPWVLLLLILAITVIKSHTEVESLTLFFNPVPASTRYFLFFSKASSSSFEHCLELSSSAQLNL